MAGGMMNAFYYTTGRNEALPDQVTNLGSSSSLTNIETASDAWGKFIPFSWGLSRVGGALVWASPFYKNLESFRTTTQYRSVSTWLEPPNLLAGQFTPTRQTSEEVYETGSSVTTISSYYIDAAYSLGFEGDLRQNRLLQKVRINGNVVYDASTGFIQAGIAFSVRRGDQLAIDPVMADFIATTGKYFYPGQTYIVFDKLPLGAFGNAMPQSVDVEFKVDDVGAQGVSYKFEEPEDSTSTYRGLPFLAEDYGRIFFVRSDIGANGIIASYDINTGLRFPDVPIIGPAAALVKDVRTDLGNYACGPKSAIGYVGTGIGGVGNHIAIDLLNGYTVSANVPFWCVGTEVQEDTGARTTFVGTNFNSDQDLRIFKTVITRQGNSLLVQASAVAAPFGQSAGLHGSADGLSAWWKGLKAYSYDGSTFKEILLNASTQVADKPATMIHGSLAWNGRVCFLVARTGEPTCFETYSAADGALISRVASPVIDITLNPRNGAETLGSISQGVYGQLTTANNFFVFDMRAGSVRAYAYTLPFPGAVRIWSGKLRKFITVQTGTDATETAPVVVGTLGIYGPDDNYLGISLPNFLQTLYGATRKFSINQINSENITDTIKGALIVQSLDVDKLADDICFVWRIEKTQNAAGVKFYRDRGLSGELDIKAEIDVSELAVLNEESGVTIQTSRKAMADVPAALTIRFIDPDNEYKTNEVTVRNPDTSIPNTATKSVSLPIVMTVIDANILALNCINDMNNKAETHKFRLPSKYSYLQSRDIIKINHGRYSDTIRITQDDFGGDFTVDCEGETVVAQVRVEVPPIELPARDSGGSGTVARTTVYVIDAPLLSPEMEPGSDKILQMLAVTKNGNGRWTAGYATRRDTADGQPVTLFTAYPPNTVFVMTTTNKLTDKRCTVDKDQLQGSISGVWNVANNKTRAQIDADATANLAYYGAPGRWEIVQFERVLNGKISGIVRGLRGTEHNCGKHEIGDLFIIPQYGVATATQDKAKVGTEQTYRGVSDGTFYEASADSFTGEAEGNSLRPFIPGAITVARQGNGDLAVSWDRRDRLGGSGWGTDTLPESDGALSYVVTVHAANGAVLRTFPGQPGTALTYTAADQATDGLSGATTVRLAVQAIGKLPGFKEVRAYNV